MAFSVITYNDEAELAAAVQGTVTTYKSEDELDAGIALATSITAIVTKGGYYTLVDNALITNVSLKILSKGAKYTVILETI